MIRARPGSIALLAALCAGCRIEYTLREFDQLARETKARTIVLGEELSLYSPYDTVGTRMYLACIEAERASVFALFGIEDHETLVVQLQPDAGIGIEAHMEGEGVAVDRGVEVKPEADILGHANGCDVVIRVAPPMPLAGAPELQTILDPSVHAQTIRHELTHVASGIVGMRGSPWLSEGLAHAVEWFPLVDGHFSRDELPPELRYVPAFPREMRSIDALLAWEQEFPADDEDRLVRALAATLVAFAVERQSAPSFRERVLGVAALDGAQLRAMQPEWSAWLDALSAVAE